MFMRDVAVLQVGSLHFMWQLGVNIVFAIESSVKHSSGMLFVKGFEDSRVQFENDVVLAALEASWSASRILSGPEYAMAPPVYHALAATTQIMNTSVNMVYCTVSLFEGKSASVTADMFATVRLVR